MYYRLRRSANTGHFFAMCWTRILLLILLFHVLSAQSFAQDLRGGFLNPPDDAWPMMRWWWFGPAVTKPELKKELETMQSAGIGGVEIQPVYPLMLDDEAKDIKNLQYFSPEFLEDVNFANQTARSLGLRVDITLGSGWPYGGPKTTLALAAGRLKVVGVPITGSRVTPPTLVEGDSLIAAFAVLGTEKEFDPATARRIDLTTGSVTAAAGAQTALFFIASHTKQMVKRPAAGAEGYVLDHFSRAAIEEHLADVATPLVNAFGSQPPYSVFSDSLEVYGADWTAELPKEFERRRGYDLIPHLPELLAGDTLEAAAVRHDWGVTLSDLIRDNYLAPLTQFAEAHQTRFRSQTYGEPAVTLADEAVPNLPEGEGPQWRAFSFTRWTSSASHLYGRNVTSAETWTWLHSPAFRATPLDMKAEADRMFLLGVNQIVGHGYPYSPPGAGEPGWSLYAAAVFNSHNPWFPVMPDITKYLQRVSWLLRQGKPANDIAILLPEDDAQAAFTPGHVSVTDEMKKRITPGLMGAILDAGYNVDYIDAATIEKLGMIPYPVLVIPPTERIPLATYKKIESYAGNGKVIALEKTPSLGPGLMEQDTSAEIAAASDRLFKGSGHKGISVESIGEIANALHHALAPDLDATGKTEGLGFIHRTLADSDIYFVVNTGNRTVDASVQFRSNRPAIEAWDPDGGEVLYADSRREGARVPLMLAPYESRIFVLEDRLQVQRKATAQAMVESPGAKAEQLADLSTGWRVRFADDAAPKELEKLASWTELPGRKYYSGEVVYSRSVSINHAPAGSAHIFLDLGTGATFEDKRRPNASGMLALLDPPIREAAIVFVSGKRAGSLWHPPYRVDVSEFVHEGENQIEVHVYNTAINLLAGQPPRDYTALRAKYGRRFDPQDMDNLQPIPSGLFGPIHLILGARSTAQSTAPTASAPGALQNTRPDAAVSPGQTTGQITDPGATFRTSLPTAKNPSLPTLYLVGDSTVRNGKGDGAGGQWGWGEPLVDYFDASKINVVNRAIGGRSSRTYISEGRWDELLAMLKSGDFVVFQFGHNDSGPLDDTSRARGTLPGIGDESKAIDNPITRKHEVVHTYGWYMKKYVEDTLAKGAIPIVCSPIPRKIWADGKVVRNADNYGGWARQVADSEKEAFVDLNEIIARRYDSLGQAQVETLFADPHTHTGRAGAEFNAECVVAGLKTLKGNPLGGYLSAKGLAVTPDSGK